MLVVLAAGPRTAPLESVLDEEPVAEVAFFYLVRPLLAAVSIFTGAGWLYEHRSVFPPFDIRVVERVDVDGHPQRMFRQFLGARNGAEVEAAGVVGLHRPLVVGIIVVNQLHAFDRVVVFIKFLKDFFQVVGDEFITNQLPDCYLAVGRMVRQPQVAQFRAGHRTILLVGFPLHPLEHGVADGVDGERLGVGRQNGEP